MTLYRINTSEVRENPEAGIRSLLSPSWGTQPNGSFAAAFDFLCDVGAPALNKRCEIPRVALRGQWSGLAAAAMNRLILSNRLDKGANTWDVGMMVLSKRDPQTLQHHVASSQTHAGVLQNALGFDWRPGIAIDGVVVLALFGQRQSGVYRPGGRNLDQDGELEVQASIEKFAAFTAVGAPVAWGQRHLGSAVAFTQEVLKTVKNNEARAQIIDAWFTALTREPSLAKELNDQQKLALVDSLSQAFSAHFYWTTQKVFGVVTTTSLLESDCFERIVSALFPETNVLDASQARSADSKGLGPALATLQGEARDAAWARVFAQTFEETPKLKGIFNALADEPSRPSEKGLEWAKAWVKSFGAEHVARLQAQDLDRVWQKPGAPASKRPRM